MFKLTMQASHLACGLAALCNSSQLKIPLSSTYQMQLLRGIFGVAGSTSLDNQDESRSVAFGCMQNGPFYVHRQVLFHNPTFVGRGMLGSDVAQIIHTTLAFRMQRHSLAHQ